MMHDDRHSRPSLRRIFDGTDLRVELPRDPPLAESTYLPRIRTELEYVDRSHQVPNLPAGIVSPW
jgi:hypothetical protein